MLPTIVKPKVGPAAGPNAGKAPAILIPFTRAARKKSSPVTTITTVPSTSAVTLAPLQIPANGYLRRLVLDITGVTAGNLAAAAFNADGPAACLASLAVSAANGDSLINAMSGFTAQMLQKYGCFNNNGANDITTDPTYSVTTGAVATGGSFHFQLDVPFEVDERDALGALPNMAANQAFQLQLTIDTLAHIYATAPTTAPTITINVLAEYWAAPAITNAQGVGQQTAPRVANTYSILQSQMPTITPSTDQVIQLLNVGNTIRFIYFELRTAAGVRTDADWPQLMNFLINNDRWNAKTKNNWIRQIGKDYNLTGAKNAVPTSGALDNGVYVMSDFINSGSPGKIASGASNRDLLLVTGSATAMNIEAVNWGAAAGSLLVVTNSLKVADPASLYSPLGV